MIGDRAPFTDLPYGLPGAFTLPGGSEVYIRVDTFLDTANAVRLSDGKLVVMDERREVIRAITVSSTPGL